MGIGRIRKAGDSSPKLVPLSIISFSIVWSWNISFVYIRDRQAIFQAVWKGKKLIYQHQQFAAHHLQALRVICRGKGAKKINPVAGCLKFVTDGLHLCWKIWGSAN